PPLFSLFFSLLPPPPPSTLFPYTTLFRSRAPRCRNRRRGSPRPRPYAGCAARVGASARRSGPSRGHRAARGSARRIRGRLRGTRDRKSTRLNSSHLVISYAVFCLKKKNKH